MRDIGVLPGGPTARPTALALHQFGNTPAHNPFNHVQIALCISGHTMWAIELAGVNLVFGQVRPAFYLNDILIRAQVAHQFVIGIQYREPGKQFWNHQEFAMRDEPIGTGEQIGPK
jgi:hypothetical protein